MKAVHYAGAVALFSSLMALSQGQQGEAQKTELSAALMQLRSPEGTANITWNVQHLQKSISSAASNDKWLAKAYYELGQARKQGEDFEGAVQAYKACQELPESVSGLHGVCAQQRMVCLNAMGNSLEAIKAAEDVSSKSAKRQDVAANALMLKAQWLRSLPPKDGGGSKAAAKAYEQYIKRAEGKGRDWQKLVPSAYRGLASLYTDTGETQKAIKAYDDFLRLFPSNSDASYLALERERLHEGQGLRVPRSAYLKIIEQFNVDTGAGMYVLYTYAMDLYMNQEFREAERQLLRAAKVKPNGEDVDYSEELMLDVLVLGTTSQNQRKVSGEFNPLLRTYIADHPNLSGVGEARKVLKASDQLLSANSKTDFTPFALFSVGAVAITAGAWRFKRRRGF